VSGKDNPLTACAREYTSFAFEIPYPTLTLGHLIDRTVNVPSIRIIYIDKKTYYLNN